MSRQKPRRRAVWVGLGGRERVEVLILRECKAWTLCKVVSDPDGRSRVGAVERFHPDDLRSSATSGDQVKVG